MTEYDLIIVGAGPAGLSLARELADSQLKILLLDWKKNAEDVRYTTSGSFIDPQKWNLPDQIINPIREVHFSSAHETAVKKGNACVIDRRKLLAFFEKESRRNAGIRIEYRAAVCDAAINKNGIDYITFRQHGKTQTASAKLYADCSGLNAVLSRRIGLKPARCDISAGIEYIVPLIQEPYSIDLMVGSAMQGGYGWIFPLDVNRAIVGYGSLDRSVFPALEQRLRGMWKTERVASRCRLEPIEKHHGVLRTGKSLKKLSRGNVLLIGDTAIQTNPLVGEGIRFVMDAGRIAAPWIKMAIESGDMRKLDMYSTAWRRKYDRKYACAGMIQKVLKANSSNDGRMDSGVRRIRAMSDGVFIKMLSGDINAFLMARTGIEAIRKLRQRG